MSSGGSIAMSDEIMFGLVVCDEFVRVSRRYHCFDVIELD